MSEYSNTAKNIKEWLENSPERIDFKVNSLCDKDSLRQLRLTEESYLGYITGYYSHLCVCDGYINLLCGQGTDSITTINALDERGMPGLFPGALIIAYDTEGNLFALNGGVKASASLGNVLYLPKNSFYWEDLEIGYSSFLKWILGITAAELEKNAWKECDGKIYVPDINTFLLGKAAAYNIFLKQGDSRNE